MMNKEPAMSDLKLLPCPCCGSSDVYLGSVEDSRSWVICGKCGLTANSLDTLPECDPVEVWNTRRSQPEATAPEKSEYRKGYEQANTDYCKMIDTNCHYRERVFNEILKADSAEGMNRFTRTAPAQADERCPIVHGGSVEVAHLIAIAKATGLFGMASITDIKNYSIALLNEFAVAPAQDLSAGDRVDAKRYRFLRNISRVAEMPTVPIVVMMDDAGDVVPDDVDAHGIRDGKYLDAAIDAAILQSQNK